jgi:aldoxime dehydratase
MESAIPSHLQTARTRHRRVGDDYAPPYPSFVARHRPSVTRVVMAYFGVQSRGTLNADAEQALARLASDFTAADGPTHWDRASYVDEADFTNVVTVAYWDDRQKFDRWFPAARERWTGDQRTNNGLGPSSKRFTRRWKAMRPCSPPSAGPKASLFWPTA